MNERFGQYRLPNIIAPGAEPPSREGPKTFLSAEDISAQDHILKTRHDASRQGSDQTSHFRSRFNGWVRAVALAIVRRRTAGERAVRRLGARKIATTAGLRPARIFACIDISGVRTWAKVNEGMVRMYRVRFTLFFIK